jgi:hypothetical protein
VINPAAGPFMVRGEPAKIATNMPPIMAVNTPIATGNSLAFAMPKLRVGLIRKQGSQKGRLHASFVSSLRGHLLESQVFSSEIDYQLNVLYLYLLIVGIFKRMFKVHAVVYADHLLLCAARAHGLDAKFLDCHPNGRMKCIKASMMI